MKTIQDRLRDSEEYKGLFSDAVPQVAEDAAEIVDELVATLKLFEELCSAGQPPGTEDLERARAILEKAESE